MTEKPFDPYHRWLGIPPKHQPANHYRLLGLELFEASSEVIRDAVERSMAHVRRNAMGEHADDAQRILNEIGAAKACLLDRDSRAAYDLTLRTTVVSQDASTTVAPEHEPEEVFELELARPNSAEPQRLSSTSLGQRANRSRVRTVPSRQSPAATIDSLLVLITLVFLATNLSVIPLRSMTGEFADRKMKQGAGAKDIRGIPPELRGRMQSIRYTSICRSA